MKSEIENATRVLVGKKLWGPARAADMAMFNFGERREVPAHRGGMKEVGEYALHVQCHWRITRGDEVVVGSSDLYYPADYEDEHEDLPEDFDWDHKPNRRDRLLDALFAEHASGFTVQGIEVGPAGSLYFELAGGFILEVFPSDSLSHEHWRLFRPSTEERHFVVTGRGIEN